jgi:hypothetical protein
MIDELVNWKVYGRKPSLSNLIYYPGFCMAGLRKTTKNSAKVTRPRCPVTDIIGEVMFGYRCLPDRKSTDFCTDEAEIMKSQTMEIRTFRILATDCINPCSRFQTTQFARGQVFYLCDVAGDGHNPAPYYRLNVLRYSGGFLYQQYNSFGGFLC